MAFDGTTLIQQIIQGQIIAGLGNMISSVQYANECEEEDLVYPLQMHLQGVPYAWLDKHDQSEAIFKAVDTHAPEHEKPTKKEVAEYLREHADAYAFSEKDQREWDLAWQAKEAGDNLIFAQLGTLTDIATWKNVETMDAAVTAFVAAALPEPLQACFDTTAEYYTTSRDKWVAAANTPLDDASSAWSGTPTRPSPSAAAAALRHAAATRLSPDGIPILPSGNPTTAVPPVSPASAPPAPAPAATPVAATLSLAPGSPPHLGAPKSPKSPETPDQSCCC